MACIYYGVYVRNDNEIRGEVKFSLRQVKDLFVVARMQKDFFGNQEFRSITNGSLEILQSEKNHDQAFIDENFF
ncbi:hypothetical protein DERP_003926 [Dermatophagoides pteronyssinus]|uniref:Uncharacterized protein n=1 Tax=Dermatophagoides pteronyssinus TaxID=6956 RepID=A0ABQ8J8B9_DERPT|nr:hypothetical protein DERP_003926 [Dermatophagoides pteronyssinus]